MSDRSDLSWAPNLVKMLSPVQTLTLAELRRTAQQKARRGIAGSAIGVTYAQAAERAAEAATLDEPEQLARWWVHEKLDAGAFVTSEWCGEVDDLPLGLDPDIAEAVVVRAAELWAEVVFEAFQESELSGLQ